MVGADSNGSGYFELKFVFESVAVVIRDRDDHDDVSTVQSRKVGAWVILEKMVRVCGVLSSS